MSENTSEWVEMTYNGLHDGPVQYKGYLSRKYLVKRGDKPLVHPDDVPRLEKVIVRGKQMFARQQVKATVAAASAPAQFQSRSGSQAPGDPVETKPIATDKARELATEAGLNLVTITGTGKDGLITVADVRGAIANLTGHE